MGASYINFCVENTVDCPVFSTTNPIINPDMKALLKEKKRAFKSRNKDELKTREGKDRYMRKVEEQLLQNNTNSQTPRSKGKGNGPMN